MKKIIFGTGMLAELIEYYLKQENSKVDKFVVEKQFLPDNADNIISLETFLDNFPPDECEIYNCIGYSAMNKHRKRIHNLLNEKGYILTTYIHPKATVLIDSIPQGNLIFENAVISPFVKLGVGNICYPNSLIGHHSTIGNFNFFSVSSTIAGAVHIENECFFGANSCTKDHIHIGNQVLVGAGAYAFKDLKDRQVVKNAQNYILEDKTSLDFL